MRSFRRPRRALWGDARFLIGIALVALSIGGVWLVLSSSGSTTPVLVASRTIVRGEALTSDDMQVVEANLGALTGDYVQPEGLGSGDIAARTLVEGELIPRSAVAGAGALRTTTVVIESRGIPAEVVAGTVVEVWQAMPPDEAGTTSAPRVLIADAVVSSLVTRDGVLASDDTGVELVIDRTEVADVLAAVTAGAVLSVVPIGTLP